LGVTTTVDDDMLLTLHSTAHCVLWTPPAGMSEVLDSSGCSNADASNVDMEINQLALGVAGPTGDKTATNDTAAVAVTKTLALRKATAAVTCDLSVQLAKPIAFRSQATAVVESGTQVTVSKPAGAAEGDVLLAGITFGGATMTMSAIPTDWALVRQASNGGVWFTNTYTHVVGPSEPANYAWTISVTGKILGDITAYSGVDTVTPVDVSAAATAFQIMPTMTTTVPNVLLVAYFGGANSTTVATWPAAPGMFERSELTTTSAASYLSVSHQEQVWPTAGATGTRTNNSTPGVNGPVGQWLALRPAANSVIGTGSISITSPAGPTLRSVSFATSAVTFTTGERLQVAVTAPSDPVNCGVSVSYDGVSEPSKLTVATIVPEGVAGLLLLAPALPLGARWWKKRRQG
jgi:hypothetical protein